MDEDVFDAESDFVAETEDELVLDVDAVGVVDFVMVAVMERLWDSEVEADSESDCDFETVDEPDLVAESDIV